MNFSIIVTVKNRREHFEKIFSSLITQIQSQKYELIIVDYASQDSFRISLERLIETYRPIASDKLLSIKVVTLQEDVPFNSGKAKNVGSAFASYDVLSFTDADVFLGMSYHRKWLSVLDETPHGTTFFASRVQESSEMPSKRVHSTVNYGNMIVRKSDFVRVGGFDEDNSTWGGDDDDIIHRLKLTGLREINPTSRYDALHTSILHDDEERLKFLEDPRRDKSITTQKFRKIYENKSYYNKTYLTFLNKMINKITSDTIYVP